MTKSARRKTGARLCKVCAHDGRATIDALLDRGDAYPEIIAWAKENHPDAPELNPSNLSRHKSNHPLWKVAGLELPAKGAGKALVPAGAPLTPLSVRAAVPPLEERVTLAEATAIVLNLALQNALRNPESVTLKDAAQFAELGRKLGLRGNEEDDFRKAWEQLAGEKGAAKAAKKVKVKVTKEIEASRDEGEEPGPEVIDVTPPDNWAMPKEATL